VKYLILIYSNPRSRELWEGFSDADKSAGLAEYAALTEELTASGELVFGAPLADPSQAKRIAPGEGGPLVTDGPFAETKEQLAGFVLLECESLERAHEIAARVPEAPLDLVEVRPVLDLKALEP
jgi:hypothetical protein